MPDQLHMALGPSMAAAREQSLRCLHREEVRRLKAQHGLFTHKGACSGTWMALSMPQCIEALKGYGLSDEEKTDGVALMAGYCRLLDEAGLIEDGHRTELDAVRAVVARLRPNTQGQPPQVG